MWKIISELWLGTKKDSENVEDMRRNGITHVVNCASECNCMFPEVMQYLHLRLRDPDDSLATKIADTMKFINVGRHEGSVLVHCTGGLSRSPSVIMSYLIHCGMTVNDATTTLTRAVTTRPNDMFLRQICSHYGIPLNDTQIEELVQRLGESCI